MRETLKLPYILNKVITDNHFSTYLELGLHNPYEKFFEIECNHKLAVGQSTIRNWFDINFYYGTTQDFFNQNHQLYDLIILDNTLYADEILRDISVAIKHLSNEGFLVLHKTQPKEDTGDAWKAIRGLISQAGDLFEFKTLQYDEGITFIKPLSKVEIEFYYQDFNYEQDFNIQLLNPEYDIQNINCDIVSYFTSLYNTPQKSLERTVKTVLNQTNPHWEWILIDDSNNEADALRLKKYFTSLQNKRIRYYRLSEQTGGNIGLAKWRATSLCRGKYLAELDHDDLLMPELTNDILKNADGYDFIYTNSAGVTVNDENELGLIPKYIDGFAMGYGSFRDTINVNPLTGTFMKYNECIVVPVNPKTIRHIVGIANHIRVWNRDFYYKILGHNQNTAVTDDYELVVRSFLAGGKFLHLDFLGYLQINTGDNTTDKWRNSIQDIVSSIVAKYNKEIKAEIERRGQVDWAYELFEQRFNFKHMQFWRIFNSGPEFSFEEKIEKPIIELPLAQLQIPLLIEQLVDFVKSIDSEMTKEEFVQIVDNRPDAIEREESVQRFFKYNWPSNRYAKLAFLAMCCDHQENYEKACFFLELALEEHPELRASHVELIKIEMKLQNWGKVYELSTRALEIAEQKSDFFEESYYFMSPTLNDYLRISCLKLGLIEEAYEQTKINLIYYPQNEYLNKLASECEIFLDKNKKIAVYTYLENEKEQIILPKIREPHIDYIYFAEKDYQIDGWKYQEIHDEILPLDLKIRPHNYLKNYEYSVWIDKNVEIIGSLTELFLEELVYHEDLIATFNHPTRDCIYDEARITLNQEICNFHQTNEQMMRYKNYDYPKQNGLIESDVLIRKHTSARVQFVMEDWWNEIIRYNNYEDISLNFALWKNQVQINWLGGTLNFEGNNLFRKCATHSPIKYATYPANSQHEKKIEVSVIIPVYNGEKDLSRCLDSILNQTIYNFEIIIVNDGSTDGSTKIIEAYHIRHQDKIRVIDQVNLGVTKAMGKGVQSARGEYVLSIDQDDWIEARTLEVILAKAKEEESDVVYFKNYEVKDGNSVPIDRYFKVPLWSKLVKTSIYQKLDYKDMPNIVLHNDRLINDFLDLYIEKISYVDDYLYYWVQNPESMSNKPEFHEKRFRETFIYYGYVTKKFKELGIYDVQEEIINRLKSYFKFWFKNRFEQMMDFIYEHHEDGFDEFLNDIVPVVSENPTFCEKFNFFNEGTSHSLKNLHLSTEVPVIIISYNNLGYVKNMVRQLKEIGINNKFIWIWDNFSTCDEMVQYLKEIANIYNVVQNKENLGPRFFVQDDVFEILPEFFAVTDPDLELNANLPTDFLEVLKGLTIKNSSFKAGFALAIGDEENIDESLTTFQFGRDFTVRDWESRFWIDKLHQTDDLEVYSALTDTTFAVYNKKFVGNTFLNGLRVAGDYTCKHLPWYKDNYIDCSNSYEFSQYSWWNKEEVK